MRVLVCQRLLVLHCSIIIILTALHSTHDPVSALVRACTIPTSDLMSTKNLTSSFPLELDAALNSSHSVSVRLQSYRERHHILRSGRSIGEQDRAMLNDVDMVGVDAAAPVGAHAEAVAAGEEEGREEQEAVGEVEAIGDDKPETVSDTPRSSDYPPSVPGQSASSILPSRRREWPSGIAWIPPKLNWKGIRPVVRSAVALWLGLMLLIVYDSEVLLGQAAFLVLIVSVLSPASLPIATQLEWSILQILISAFSWAYTCLVLLIANAVRSQYSFNEAEFTTYSTGLYASSSLSLSEMALAIQLSIFHGDYLEQGSSAVCAIGLGIGCGFLLWLRGFTGSLLFFLLSFFIALYLSVPFLTHDFSQVLVHTRLVWSLVSFLSLLPSPSDASFLILTTTSVSSSSFLSSVKPPSPFSSPSSSFQKPSLINSVID